MDIFWQIVLANVLANSADVMNIYYSFLDFWKKYLSIVIFVLFWNTKIMELRWKLWVAYYLLQKPIRYVLWKILGFV